MLEHHTDVTPAGTHQLFGGEDRPEKYVLFNVMLDGHLLIPDLSPVILLPRPPLLLPAPLPTLLLTLAPVLALLPLGLPPNLTNLIPSFTIILQVIPLELLVVEVAHSGGVADLVEVVHVQLG